MSSPPDFEDPFERNYFAENGDFNNDDDDNRDYDQDQEEDDIQNEDNNEARRVFRRSLAQAPGEEGEEREGEEGDEGERGERDREEEDKGGERRRRPEEEDEEDEEEDEEDEEEISRSPKGGDHKGKGRYHNQHNQHHNHHHNHHNRDHNRDHNHGNQYRQGSSSSAFGSSYSSTTSSFIIKSSSPAPTQIQGMSKKAVPQPGRIESDEEADNTISPPQYRDPIEDALQSCFDQVTRPVSFFLCFLGWRPFPFFIHHHHFVYRILDYLYVVLVFTLLSCSFLFGLYYSVEVDRSALISEYVMEAVVSFFLGIYGMWYFRREEGRAFEELSALIETVFLYSSKVTDKRTQGKLTYSLTNYLIAAGYFLLFFMGYSLWVSLTLSAQLIKDVYVPIPVFALGVLIISFGKVIEHAFYVATIVIYWIICRLHMQFLDEIRDRLMKRTISLSRATRDIASIKKLIGDTNQGWGVAASFLAFSLAVQAIFIQVKFFEGEQFQFEYLQAGIGFSLSVLLIFANLFPASLVCWSGERLKGMSWKLRAEQHYRKSTPEQVDSFLLFCSNTKMSAKIMGYPVWKEYLFFLAGLISITVFFLWRIGLYSAQ